MAEKVGLESIVFEIASSDLTTGLAGRSVNGLDQAEGKMTTKLGAAAVFLLSLCAATTAEAAETSVTYSRTIQTACPDSGCSIGFPDVQTGKRLEIESVSCIATIDAASALIIPVLEVRRNGLGQGFRAALIPTKLGVQNDNAVFALSHTGLVPVAANLSPRVTVITDVSNSVVLACTISGHLFTRT